MGPGKGDTTVWYQVTRHLQVFCGLTVGQRTPRVWGITGLVESFIKRIQLISSPLLMRQDFLHLHGDSLSYMQMSHFLTVVSSNFLVLMFYELVFLVLDMLFPLLGAFGRVLILLQS